MKTFKLVLFVSTLLVIACSKKDDNKKSWTCTCNVKSAGATNSQERSLEISNKEEVDAKSECESFGSTSVNGNGTWTCNVVAK